MASVTTRKDGRHELRESVWTERGPRSRTLATFRELTPEVATRALARATGAVSRGDLGAAARRAGVVVHGGPADRAATALIRALDEGHELDPRLERLVLDRLGVRTGARVSDAERAAGAWLGRSGEERGAAIRDLLRLTARFPAANRPEDLSYPVIRTSGA